MSWQRVVLSSEEQVFLTEMLEIKDPVKAAERFVKLMVEEKANPQDLKKYLSKIIERVY